MTSPQEIRIVQDAATTRTYDISGHLLATTFKSWGTITYTYDDAFHLVTATYPDGSRHTWRESPPAN